MWKTFKETYVSIEKTPFGTLLLWWIKSSVLSLNHKEGTSHTPMTRHIKPTWFAYRRVLISIIMQRESKQFSIISRDAWAILSLLLVWPLCLLSIQHQHQHHPLTELVYLFYQLNFLFCRLQQFHEENSKFYRKTFPHEDIFLTVVNSILITFLLFQTWNAWRNQ